VDKLLLYDLDAGRTVLELHEAWSAMQSACPLDRAGGDGKTGWSRTRESGHGSAAGQRRPYLLRSYQWGSQPSEENFYRADGTALPQFTHYGGRWYQRISLVGGLIEQLELNTATYYDLETLEPVFRTTLNYEAD
jgi:hypothetical protein